MLEDDCTGTNRELTTQQVAKQVYDDDVLRATAVSVYMTARVGRRTLPLESEHPAVPSNIDQQLHVEVLELSSPQDWNKLNNLIRAKASPQIGPWLRCISLLRCTLKAKLCVVEHHYVCLDHRSEVASFGSQLDAPINQSTIRLHFFNVRFDQKKVTRLGPRETKGYLGYIICRDSGGPIVGRSLLKTPNYVEVSTEVEEPVNLLGQQLWVRGVPFMQQDERFAVCAHVGIWTIAYTAFRRGQIERKLIAEVVSAATFAKPMHPVPPPGVFANEVGPILTELGLGAFKYETDFESQTDLPIVSSESLNADADAVAVLEAVLNAFKRAEQTPVEVPLGASGVKESRTSEIRHVNDDYQDWLFDSSPNAFAVELLRTLANTDDDELIEVIKNDEAASETIVVGAASVEKYRAMTIQLIDQIFAVIVRPYLESGIPVYCDTGDHAIVLCGVSEGESGPIFYFHDDQFGPYLSSRSIILNSRTHFQRQAFQSNLVYEDSAPDVDLSTAELSDHNYSDNQRSVRAIVIGAPRRLLLPPTSAMRVVEETMYDVGDTLKEYGDSIADFGDDPNYRTSLLMGIDYKAIRRSAALKSRDHSGARVFASIHLSEWIVLVEGLSEDRESVHFEFVFDGTSSEGNPLLQFARFGREVRCVHPQTFPAVETGRIRSSTFEPVETPRVLRKSLHRVV